MTSVTQSRRKKNLRVEIYFYGKKSDEEAKVKGSVLDQAVAEK